MPTFDALPPLAPGDFPEGEEIERPARSWIFREGDPSDGTVWFVLDGEAHVVTEEDEARPVIPYALAAGDLFGDHAFLRTDHRRSAGVRIARPARLWRITRRHWEARLADPVLQGRYLRTLFLRFERLDRAVRRLGVQGARRRLAMLLLERAAQFGEPVPMPAHETLAMMVACTRERATRLLGEFRAAGLVRLEQHHAHLDHRRLRAIAEGLA